MNWLQGTPITVKPAVGVLLVQRLERGVLRREPAPAGHVDDEGGAAAGQRAERRRLAVQGGQGQVEEIAHGVGSAGGGRLLPGSAGSAAETDLVAVRVAVGHLAHAVLVGLPTGVLGPHVDAQVPGLLQAADVVGDVDGVLAQRLDRHDLQRALVRGGQDDARGGARLVGLQPADGDDAPPVARLQARGSRTRAAASTGRCPGRAAAPGSRPRRPRRRCASRGPRGRCCSARRGRSRSPGRCRRAASGPPSTLRSSAGSGCTGAPGLVVGAPWSASAQDGMVRT